MLKNNLTLFILLISLYSCNESVDQYETISQEEVTPFVLREDCNVDLYPDEHNAGFCSDSINQMKCEVIERNNYYKLTEAAFAKFPNFCLNAPERLYFKNTTGQYQAFEVVQKLWSKRRFYWDEGCETSTYCDINEIAAVYLKSLNEEHYLALSLETLVANKALERMATHILIYDLNCPGQERCSGQLIEEQIEPAPAGLSSSLLINDIQYDQAFVRKVDRHSSSLQEIYYSLEYGLIGFKDSNEVIWNLVI